MQTLIVICGFLGPLCLIGVVGTIIRLHMEKKENARNETNIAAMGSAK